MKSHRTPHAIETLGTMPRDYDDGTNTGRSYTPLPQHRRDDRVPYMRPDRNDEMEVLAVCFRHLTRQPRKDLKAGVAAPCPHGERCASIRPIFDSANGLPERRMAQASRE